MKISKTTHNMAQKRNLKIEDSGRYLEIFEVYTEDGQAFRSIYSILKYEFISRGVWWLVEGHLSRSVVGVINSDADLRRILKFAARFTGRRVAWNDAGYTFDNKRSV